MLSTIRLSGLLAAALAAASCSGSPPDSTGPTTEGGLAPCPETPNCVHTGHRHPDGIEGFILSEEALALSDEEILDAVAEGLESLPRTHVTLRTERYLAAESRSRVFRFVDDVEILLPSDFREREAPEMDVRSASRMGHSDMGVNADRVESLRRRLEDDGLLGR